MKLGGNVLTMRHMQQTGNLADQMLFVLVKVGIGVGHNPQTFDQLNFLLLGTVIVQQRGEAVVVVARRRSLF